MTKIENATYLQDNYEHGFVSDHQWSRPHTYIFEPIFDSLYENRTLTGFMTAFIRLDKFFTNVMPETVKGVVLVLDGTCNDNYHSFRVDGHRSEYLGPGKHRDFLYEDIAKDFVLAPKNLLDDTDKQPYCQHNVRVYPSAEFEKSFYNGQPFFYATAIAAAFAAAMLVFLIYDNNVKKRNTAVMDSATQTQMIVSNLFPSNVRDRMMAELQSSQQSDLKRETGGSFVDRSGKSVPVQDLAPGTSETLFGSRPIADHFSAVTIMLYVFCIWLSDQNNCSLRDD